MIFWFSKVTKAVFYLEKLERGREVRQIGENVIVAVLPCGHTVCGAATEKKDRGKKYFEGLKKKKTYLLFKY